MNELERFKVVSDPAEATANPELREVAATAKKERQRVDTDAVIAFMSGVMREGSLPKGDREESKTEKAIPEKRHRVELYAPGHPLYQGTKKPNSGKETIN